VAANLLEARKIIVSDPVERMLQGLSRDGICVTKSNLDVVASSNVVVLAVKPDKIKKVLTEITPKLTSDHLLISIAAGVDLETMESVLPKGVAVARVMPNTPCLVGELAGAYTPGTHVTDVQERIIENVFGSVGLIEKVPESAMDAVTGLSGSGPAYVFMMIEAMADGAVRNGLPRAIALQLAAQTVRGAATMVLETGAHPGALKDQVCSPGGSTIAAVEALEMRGFRATAMSAVTASAQRTKELRDQFK
jgi:pyrroline-5-carboxylate reductase